MVVKENWKFECQPSTPTLKGVMKRKSACGLGRVINRERSQSVGTLVEFKAKRSNLTMIDVKSQK